MKRILLALACAFLLAPTARSQQPVQSLGSGVQGTSDAAWTSATGSNTAVTLISNTASYNSILVTLVQGSTITGGVVTFEQSIDNSTWTTVQGVQVGATTIMGPTYTLVASTNISFLFPVNAPYFRIRLSTVITGSGTVTVQHASQTMPEVGLLAGTETLGAGANLIGSVKVGDGTNNAAIKAASTAPASTDPAVVVGLSPNGGNPCLNPSSTLVSASGVTSGTSAVQIIAASGATKIYICSLTVVGVSGTTPKLSLEYGTGTNCGTGTTVFLGAFTTTAGVASPFANPVYITPASQEVCYLDTGTTPVQDYVMTYVQQ